MFPVSDAIWATLEMPFVSDEALETVRVNLEDLGQRIDQTDWDQADDKLLLLRARLREFELAVRKM